MILIHSATRSIKFQGKFIWCFNCFQENNKKRCAPFPAFVKTRGRAKRKLRNRRQQDHNKKIYGNALHTFLLAVHTDKQKLILEVKEPLS
jgi:hypothetical protein